MFDPQQQQQQQQQQKEQQEQTFSWKLCVSTGGTDVNSEKTRSKIERFCFFLYNIYI